MTLPIVTTVSRHPLIQKITDNLEISMRKAGIDIPLTRIALDTDGANAFGTPEYWEMLKHAKRAFYRLLQEHPRVLFVDSDVVFLQNPVEEMESLLDVYDLVCMTDSPSDLGVFSAGYFGMTSDLKDVFSRDDDVCDQVALKGLVEKGVKAHMLSPSKYPNGCFWYQYHRSIDPVAIHYNWVACLEEKIEKMKAFGHWYIGD